MIDQGYEESPFDREQISAQEDLSRDIWFDLRRQADSPPPSAVRLRTESLLGDLRRDDSLRTSRDPFELERNPLQAPKPFQIRTIGIGLPKSEWSMPMPEPDWKGKAPEPLFFPIEQDWRKLR